ncbi:TPA: hypothetical protein RFM61_002124 [Klebsiella pneumoniae subsp. pneumoniae]|uniref:hypothetical protein n=1 Tax=Klebsiella pneumoniae TaxID=573 RepID=UPI000D1B9397|nr:hypothetical protein [Klebsiella pneumoniae]HCF8051312.1 hypothetical protein [Klebsiella pneumoniae]HDU3837968.1 hypothetical protein [Klebsiella pneumoniae subsp. pneumoniae]
MDIGIILIVVIVLLIACAGVLFMTKYSRRVSLILTLVISCFVVALGLYLTNRQGMDDVALMVARIIEAHPSPTPVLRDTRWKELEKQYEKSVREAVEASRPYPDEETKKVIALMRTRNHDVAILMNVRDIDAIIRQMNEEQSLCDEKKNIATGKSVACDKRKKYYFYPVEQ